MLRLGGRVFGAHEGLLLAVLADGQEPPAGASVVEVAGPGRLPELRAARPDLPVAVRVADAAEAEAAAAAGADLLCGGMWAVPAAGRHGTGLLCPAARAPDALAAGVRADGLLVDAGTPREAVAAVRSAAGAQGPPLLVCPVDGDLSGAALAGASVAVWLGARGLRVRDAGEGRQVLDMVASIAGHRPPAVAVRGMV